MPILLSPGVAVVERDFSTIVPNVASGVGGVVGRFEKGPINVPILISTEDELVDVFGKPNNTNYNEWFAASQFLLYTNRLWAVRAAPAGILNATAAGSGLEVLNYNAYEELADNDKNTAGEWIAKDAGAYANNLGVFMVDNATWDEFVVWCDANVAQFPNNVPLYSFFREQPATSQFIEARRLTSENKKDELHVLVVDIDGSFTGKRYEVLEYWDGLSKAEDATDYQGKSIYYANKINNESKYIYFSSHTDNVTAGASILPFGSLTETVVNAGYTFADIAVVPNVKTAVVVATTANLDLTGLETIDGVAVTAGQRVLVKNQTLPAENGIYVVAAGAWSRATDADISGELTNAKVYVSSGTTQSGLYYTTTFSGTLNTDPVNWTLTTIPVNFSFIQLGGGVNGTTPTDGNIKVAYDQLSNTDLYDVNLIMTGAFSADVCKHVIENVAYYRKDSVAFCSPHNNGLPYKDSDADAVTSIITYKGVTLNPADPYASYGFMDSGFKYILDRYNSKYRWVPLNGDMAGLCAQTDTIADPWWSPAGFNRGGVKNVIKLAYNPDQADRDALYPKGINSVVSFIGQGVVLYGDRTMTVKPSAFDRINVRRLFNILEKAISIAAKYSLFEFNDSFTRASFKNMVEPFLRGIQGRRGITDFLVICDSTNNTGQVIDANEFVADIYIKPARSINFIKLNFVATRTDVQFSTVVGG